MAAVRNPREQVDFLSLLSSHSRKRVVAGATRLSCRAGTVPHTPADKPAAYVVLNGLIRVFWSGPDGRQATVAFMSTNELMGGTTIMGQIWAAASVQAVTDSTLLALDVAAARAAVAESLDVVTAVATHLAAQLRNALTLVAIRSLGTVEQRLAFDLLERSCRSQLQVGRLDARTTHADLADSIGSSREVVSRTIATWRAARIVQTAPRCIRILNPMALSQSLRAYIAG